MKYEAIKSLSSVHSVRKMCKVLELKQRSYYAWLKRSEVRSKKSVRDKETARVIETVFLSNKKTYGYRKMKKALEQQGLFISEYRIRNLMRRNGMYPVTVRKYKPGRSRTLGGRFSDNILKQNFVSDKPFQKLAGDISYIKTNKGWVYLATVMDLFNREILGYAVSQSMGCEIVNEAMGNAIARSGGLKNAIFHSDRGIQYSSESFKKLLKENGIIQSMSKGGCPYDNACSESFFATLKKECVYLKKYENIEEVKKDIFEYIELFYNRKRMHSYLDYMSPIEYKLTKCG